jgi:purine nucleosidase
MNTLFRSILMGALVLTMISCSKQKTDQHQKQTAVKIPVIFDTDANNELDDQHALAYLLFNGNTFDLKGITVNATYNGGNIDEHYKEAERIVTLSTLHNKIPLLKGADGGFEDIKDKTTEESFDGAEAVNFIIDQARESKNTKLTLIAVGKLTNVALAVKKDPSITEHIRLVWLGSNYPEPGEYNQDNDTSAMNYLLKSNIPFEMVTVRYGKASGTDAVRVTKEEVNQHMHGKGPVSETAVTGRHGSSFHNFGDYSVNLFEHIDYHGDPPSRALYDMAAIAIVKNPQWAKSSTIPAPILIDNQWMEQPDNKRTIILWEDFDKEKIMADFYTSMDHYTLVNQKAVSGK